VVLVEVGGHEAREVGLAVALGQGSVRCSVCGPG
jgi:hypothetical protein